MTSTVKTITQIKTTNDLGNAQVGDYFVGNRGAGNTGGITYAPKLIQDSTPQLAADLDLNTYTIKGITSSAFLDNNNAAIFQLTPVASAVNYINMTNATTTNGPTIQAAGTDTNVPLTIYSKGSGAITLATTASTNAYVLSSGTAYQHTTNFTLPNTAASRTVTFPDASGTICYDTGSTNIDTLGTVTTGTWNASIIGMTYGGTGANLTASNGGIVWTNGTTMAVLSGTATATQLLLSGANDTPAWSAATFQSAAGATDTRLKSDGTGWMATTTTMPDTGTTGKFIIGDGTNYVESTSTIPTSAGATANKVLLSDGTNYVLSTPTFPNASATALKHIISDGTNWVASTATISDTPSTAGKLLISDGTNWITSTSTYLNSTAQGDILYSSAANTITALTKDTNATRYLSNTGTTNNPAWAQIDLTNGVTGTLPAGNLPLASQSDQETATSNTVLVTPGVQHFHPSSCKVWTRITVSGGTPTLAISYNVTSISDDGVGIYGVTIATALSSANYSAITNGNGAVANCGGRGAGAFQILTFAITTGAATDATNDSAVFGDI